jgi:hypothetical protein
MLIVLRSLIVDNLNLIPHLPYPCAAIIISMVKEIHSMACCCHFQMHSDRAHRFKSLTTVVAYRIDIIIKVFLNCRVDC